MIILIYRSKTQTWNLKSSLLPQYLSDLPCQDSTFEHSMWELSLGMTFTFVSKAEGFI